MKKKLLEIHAMNPATRKVEWNWSADALLWDSLPEDLIPKIEKEMPHMIIYVKREGEHFAGLLHGLV